ncbi:MAG TPA: TspO/MBR family protein [Terriglobales bacterium]|nr:TspO/MBR family protein [Terriglobales bacterium]
MRKSKTVQTYAAFILSALLVGLISVYLASSGMAAYESMMKPPLTPPGWAFTAVWLLLYILMGVGAAMVCLADSPGTKGALRLYVVQLFFNFMWSIIFFTLEWRLIALVWLLVLWVLAAMMARSFCEINKTAGRLQIPYLVWLTFTAYLNFAAFLLNR